MFIDNIIYGEISIFFFFVFPSLISWEISKENKKLSIIGDAVLFQSFSVSYLVTFEFVVADVDVAVLFCTLVC